MIFVTGDLHGEYDRFKTDEFKKIKKGDTLFVCGDFGFVWNGSPKEQKFIRKIGKKKFTTVFVTGCHDNYDRLKRYSESEWNGGKVRVISGKLMQLCRGEIYTVEGKTAFAFGGGEGGDSMLRAENDLWWPEEQPTAAEEKAALQNLAEAGNKVDYIITYDAPISIAEFLNVPPSDVNSRINNFLETVLKTVTFERWCFGKLHTDKVITGRQQTVYLKVIPLNKPAAPVKAKK